MRTAKQWQLNAKSRIDNSKQFDSKDVFLQPNTVLIHPHKPLEQVVYSTKDWTMPNRNPP
jgi:hypothetical protein